MDDLSLHVAHRNGDGSVALSSGSTLTRREMEVLELITAGLRNREIAARLYVSIHTVEFHATSLYAKLGVRSRTEAALVAGRIGLFLPVPQQKPEELGETGAPEKAPVPTLGLSSRARSDIMRTRISRFIVRQRKAVAAAGLALLLSAGLMGGGLAYARLPVQATAHCVNGPYIPVSDELPIQPESLRDRIRLQSFKLDDGEVVRMQSLCTEDFDEVLLFLPEVAQEP